MRLLFSFCTNEVLVLKKSTLHPGGHCLTPQLILKIYPMAGSHYYEGREFHNRDHIARYVIRHPARARFEDIEVTPEELLDFEKVLRISKGNVYRGIALTEISEFEERTWESRVAEMLAEPVIYDERECYYATQLILYFAENATTGTSDRMYHDSRCSGGPDHLLGFFFDARSVFSKIPPIDGFGFREFENLIKKCNSGNNDGYSCKPGTSVIDRYHLLLARSSLGHQFEDIWGLIRSFEILSDPHVLTREQREAMESIAPCD